MPRGVYKRTEKHGKAISEGLKYSDKAQKQRMKLLKELHKRPRTLIQIKSGRRMGQPDAIDCHHNDLCHGKLRPDDVTYMSHSEHVSLHNKLRIQNGTHNFLVKYEPQPDTSHLT